MKIESRIEGFLELSRRLTSFLDEPDQDLLQEVHSSNNWFIPEFVIRAIQGINKFLSNDRMEKWLSGYKFHRNNPGKIGIIMAGNIPLVGFHDLLSVLVSGHHAIIKTSHQDTVLTNWIVNQLADIDPSFQSIISSTTTMPRVDALIATGSDNSARYFVFHYRDIPRIIRRNRSSVGIIREGDQDDTLKKLADDIFLYFGLGCRNISKLYVPEGFNTDSLTEEFREYEFLMEHEGYMNNYRHQKAIYKVTRDPFQDGMFYTLKKSTDFVSPVSVIYYDEYKSVEQLDAILGRLDDKIQCIISTSYPTGISPGTGQFPELWDYQDKVDTLDFLLNIH